MNVPCPCFVVNGFTVCICMIIYGVMQKAEDLPNLVMNYLLQGSSGYCHRSHVSLKAISMDMRDRIMDETK